MRRDGKARDKRAMEEVMYICGMRAEGAARRGRDEGRTGGVGGNGGRETKRRIKGECGCCRCGHRRRGQM